jgi:hypothetical protein
MAYMEVEVDLESFSDDELMEEIKLRKLDQASVIGEELEHLVTAIWLKRRVGVDYQKELDDLIYSVIGKIV